MLIKEQKNIHLWRHMKIILISLFLCLTITIFNTKAMYSPRGQIEFLCKKTRPTRITYTALLKYGKEPEYQFRCKITYDFKTNTYSGEYFNNGHSAPVWESTTISDKDAERYYQNLVIQER
jgi:hypothetical protein